MLQKELAKRLKARYDTKMDGNGWLEVSSDGVPLCRIKYNGQYLSNADKTLSDEYHSKIADIQDEISTVREYVGLYEHAPQMKADGVSDYRQLSVFGNTVLAATYSEKNGFMFCTWKQNANGDSVFWGDYSPNAAKRTSSRRFWSRRPPIGCPWASALPTRTAGSSYAATVCEGCLLPFAATIYKSKTIWKKKERRRISAEADPNEKSTSIT